VDDAAELFKVAWPWATTIAIVTSPFLRVMRIAAAGLLLGLGVAVAVLTAWRLVVGDDLPVGTLLLYIAGLGVTGTLFFLWGRPRQTA
jgi:hypothetical protein